MSAYPESRSWHTVWHTLLHNAQAHCVQWQICALLSTEWGAVILLQYVWLFSKKLEWKNDTSQDTVSSQKISIFWTNQNTIKKTDAGILLLTQCFMLGRFRKVPKKQLVKGYSALWGAETISAILHMAATMNWYFQGFWFTQLGDLEHSDTEPIRTSWFILTRVDSGQSSNISTSNPAYTTGKKYLMFCLPKMVVSDFKDPQI